MGRPLSRRLAPLPPAGIVWRRRQPKNRRRAAEPAEISAAAIFTARRGL